MARYKAKPRNLRELLNKAGIETQKDFAKMVGVKEATISRFDSQSRYDIDVLVSVSKALKMNIEDLFDITENEESETE